MRRNGFQHIETYRSSFGFASFYIYKLFQSCAPDTSVWYDPYFFLYVPTSSNGFNLRLQARIRSRCTTVRHLMKTSTHRTDDCTSNQKNQPIFQSVIRLFQL